MPYNQTLPFNIHYMLLSLLSLSFYFSCFICLLCICSWRSCHCCLVLHCHCDQWRWCFSYTCTNKRFVMFWHPLYSYTNQKFHNNISRCARRRIRKKKCSGLCKKYMFLNLEAGLDPWGVFNGLSVLQTTYVHPKMSCPNRL